MNKEVLTKPKNCDNIGGSALIEGVMMRVKTEWPYLSEKFREIYLKLKNVPGQKE